MKAPKYIVDAIRTLVDYCDAHPGCDDCRLKDKDGICVIDHFPECHIYSFEEVEKYDTSKL